MLKIGGGWCSVSENTGKSIINCKLDPEMKNVTVNFSDLNITLFENDEKKSEKSPDYTIYLDNGSWKNKN